MSKLDELFGKFKSTDLVWDVYRSFKHQYKMVGLDTVFLVSQFFSTLKAEYEQLPLKIYLPMVAGGKLYPRMVVQEPPLPEIDILDRLNLREIQRRNFIIFENDLVEVTVARGNDVVLQVTGLFKDILIDTTKIKEKNYSPGSMATLRIKLLQEDPDRVAQEQKVFFGKEQDYINSFLLNKMIHVKFLKEIDNESLLKKRLELYKVSDIEDLTTGVDFGSSDSIKIVMILKNLKNPYLSNEQLLELEPTVEKKELEKMKEWIKRDVGAF